MASFQVEEELKCDKDSVVKKLKDIQAMPQYWKGTREINVLSDDGKIAEAKIRFAFPASGKVRITRLENGIRLIIWKDPLRDIRKP